MNRYGFPRFLLILLFIFAFLVPLGFIVMVLWNSILTTVVQVPMIGFWQALGLFALSRILFGGFPGKPGWAGHGRRRKEMEDMRAKWFNLSPEEKAKFRQNWKGRCGSGGTPVTPEGPAAE